jgi:hypothetical protein
MSLTGLAIGILGVWRVTHLLHAENGPWNVLERVRQRFSAGFWHTLTECFYCLSLWIAAPIAWAVSGGAREWLLIWPALSAGAILLERFSARHTPVAPAVYFEDEEKNHNVRLYEENGGAAAANIYSANTSGLHQ